MKNMRTAFYLLLAGFMLSGCAINGKDTSRGACAFAGALVGSAVTAAAMDDSNDLGTVAGGAAIGAGLAYLACGNQGPVDSDGDGVTDDLDQCPDTPTGTTVGADGCPLDSDGDGVPDNQDQCPSTPAGTTVGADGCPLDSDGDGVNDDNDECPGTPAGITVDDRGCPEAGQTLIVLEGVNFANDSADLTQEAQSLLDGTVDTLNNNAAVNVQIMGHTDSRGSESYNQTLSERRAAVVRDYLLTRGVSNSQLSSRGMGESYPVADNSTDAGRYQNRRVEFIVVE